MAIKIPKPKDARWGKKSKLLPSRSGINTLNRSQRTINDYSKQVPTNPTDARHPLLVDLMRKP